MRLSSVHNKTVIIFEGGITGRFGGFEIPRSPWVLPWNLKNYAFRDYYVDFKTSLKCIIYYKKCRVVGGRGFGVVRATIL